ncbi:carboxylesterase [Trichocoleus sp. FACHB-262]|uniref:alpha/beta hydrolase n=1 Tax=Trichocoleus sp. FACHB-262 TaxID=2692869 RepID=UPI0016846874|nr:alpha/beta fold hydrolase [Trichocoleus sp. FACHB-262]MBD2123206.1 alpha/beta hydrolase [Trichocoleus sp. FACHB-262]
MITYSEQISAIAHRAQAREDALPVRDPACRSRFWFHPRPTSKVCLFFHGFTAGPYQFEPMGEAFYQAGYNVLVPLQPGHGIAGDWNRDHPPPLPTDVLIYQNFAVDWLQQAQSLGQQVIVGGLSSGATLAAWLASEYPQQIARALLFAPYLSGTNRLVDFLVEILPVYFEWLNKDEPGHHGYDGFRIPTLRLFLDLGQELLDRVAHRPAAPMFVISSASDRATNPQDHQALAQAARTLQPQTWYHCLDEALDIPHTMMTQAEGNDYQNLLITLAKAFVESNLTWSEVLAIGDRLLHGNTFDGAVAELNLQQRTAAELSVMMALLDLKAIVAAHQAELKP